MAIVAQRIACATIMQKTAFAHWDMFLRFMTCCARTWVLDISSLKTTISGEESLWTRIYLCLLAHNAVGLSRARQSWNGRGVDWKEMALEICRKSKV